MITGDNLGGGFTSENQGLTSQINKANESIHKI